MLGICFEGLNMIEVPLTQGKVALIDDEDAERILRRSWCAYQGNGGVWYAHRGTSSNGIRRTVALHREIMNAPKGVQVDHENGDGLDCQKHNLRLVNNSQNHQNMRVARKPKISRFKGVTLDKRRGKWTAGIHVGDVNYWCGYFENEEDAARAYDAKAREVHGKFGRFNFPQAGEQSALREVIP